MNDWHDSQQPFDMPEKGMGWTPTGENDGDVNVSITVSDRRTAPSSLPVNTDENLFTQHCAVVKLDDILPNRRLREIPAPLSGPPPGGPITMNGDGVEAADKRRTGKSQP